MTNELPTHAISIRQPWAWLIVNGYKDIENRSWPTQFKGRVYVHAAKAMTHQDYEWAVTLIESTISGDIPIPDFTELERGGIVGTVEINGSVTESESPWFFGPHGFRLADAQQLSFQPCRGMLGFFKPQLP